MNDGTASGNIGADIWILGSHLQQERLVMGEYKRRGGLTILEVLILMVLFTSIFALVMSGIQRARESARATTCVGNLKQLGLACYGYLQAHGQYPSSCGVTRNPDGTIGAVDGWSWIVQILPYLEGSRERGQLYGSLDIADGRPLEESARDGRTPHSDALATSFPELLCPSFGGSRYADEAGTAAITNYKAMGATHIESLSVASPRPLVPKYNPTGKGKHGLPQHPDGACFPGTGVSGNAFNGTAYTILVVESLEPRFARWTVGAESAVVGLPPIVEYEYSWGCYTIKGLKGVNEDGIGADPSYWTYRTYLNWDYVTRPYDGADGTKGGRYGPSSNHPTTTNHLFADGAVHIVSKAIDVSVYMRDIKRSRWDEEEP